jgi:hypothetical protein
MYLSLNYRRNEKKRILFIPKLSKERRQSKVFVPQPSMNEAKLMHSSQNGKTIQGTKKIECIRSSTIDDLTLLAARPTEGTASKGNIIGEARYKEEAASGECRIRRQQNQGPNSNRLCACLRGDFSAEKPAFSWKSMAQQVAATVE